jgi:elongation factor G
MKEYTTERIRNVVLLGHGSTGKTSLAEAALFATGAITRLGRVEEGNTVSDYDPDEIKRGISINLSVVPCEWKDHKVNLIDTPGYADFVGEVKGGVRAADVGLIVVDASAGVQVGTEQAWNHAAEDNLPRAFIVNRMDRENADFGGTLQALRSAFGKQCVPVQIPIGARDAFQGVVDLVEMQAYTGDGKQGGPVPESLAAEAASYREQLVEVVAETDDELISKYLEGEELTAEEIQRGLRAGVAAGTVIPVFVASATKTIGTARLLDAIIAYLPSPLDRGEAWETEDGNTLKADPAGPLAAQVFKTAADPYVGKLTYFRVVSGTFKGDSHVWNANRGADERVGQVFVPRGKSQENVSQLFAGDIGAVAKLAVTVTGDTLCAKDRPIKLRPIRFPAPSFSVAIAPRTKSDVDKLGPALQRIAEEDPTVVVQREPSTGETILSGIGDSHIDVTIEKMKRKFGVDVESHPPKVPYRETITATATAEYIHKKQTGGHGQYARVAIKLEPLERGKGFEFVDQIVGGVVPRQYIPAVEKGVQEAMQEGVLAHYPMTDVRVTLYDGKDHPVDSSEMAFKLAAAQALKKGAAEAKPVLLEPIVKLTITVPDANTGDIMSDLNSKRAKVLGMTPSNGMTTIEALAPLAEVQRYATDLRSMTQGRGTFQMEFSHYEEVPPHLAQKVIAEAQAERGS